MQTLETKTIANYVVENIKTASIFQKYHINYSLNGDKNLIEVCKNKDVNPIHLLTELKSIDSKLSFFKNYNSWSLEFLIDYILKIHHQYAEDRIPVAINLTNAVSEKHGNTFPKLYAIQKIFLDFSLELTKQMKYEEYVVFPAIVDIITKQNYHQDFKTQIENSRKDHLKIFQKIEKIRALTNHFKQPEIECKTVHAFFYTLKSFDLDFQKHLHLENNILFPKVLKLILGIKTIA